MSYLINIHAEVVKLYYSLRTTGESKIHPDFKAALESANLDSTINGFRFGFPDQQAPDGNLRNVGVYVSGDNMYDADIDGSASFAVVVDFLLRNSDSANYLKYGDCLINYLNDLPIGYYRWVQNMSYSLPISGKNTRVTALMIVIFKPLTDSDMF